MDIRSSPLLVTLGLGVSPQCQILKKSITRSTLASPVRQTCTTVVDRMWCEKQAAARSVTASVVNYLRWRRSACLNIRQSGQLVYLLSTHAGRLVVDISFTVCFLCMCVCVSAGFLVTDISGVGRHRAMKFCRTVDLGVQQVISPFGELWPRG